MRARFSVRLQYIEDNIKPVSMLASLVPPGQTLSGTPMFPCVCVGPNIRSKQQSVSLTFSEARSEHELIGGTGGSNAFASSLPDNQSSQPGEYNGYYIL